MKKEFIIAVFISVLFAISFVFAGHLITTSTGENSYNINEDTYNIFNITINNTDSLLTGNITQVNITISGFQFVKDSNGSDSETHTFTNTSAVLSWFNDGLVMNLTWKQFWFNASFQNPGDYNITVMTLNATGVFQSNISVRVNDTTKPLVTVVYPIGGSNYSLSAVDFNLSLSDNVNISTCWFTLDNGANNYTMTINSSLTGANYTNSSILEGNYLVNFYCNDTSNLINGTVNSNFTIDTTVPVFNIISPSSGAYLNNRLVRINVSITEIYINSTNITIYNATWSVKNSSINLSSNFNISLNTVSDGLYYLNLTSSDYSGNINQTSSGFTVDTTNPLILNGTGNQNDSAVINNSFFSFNINVTEINPKNITYNLYNSSGLYNSTTYMMADANSNNTMTWRRLPNENYTYNATIFDLAGNSNSTISFRINISDTTAPTVTLQNPIDGASSTTSDYNFTFNVSDDSDVFCSLVIEGNITNVLYNINTSSTNGMYNSSFSVASHTWSVNCSDYGGNTMNSSTRSFTVTSPPSTIITSDGSLANTIGKWLVTYTVSTADFKQGYVKELAQNNRVKLIVSNTDKYIGVITLMNNSVVLEISNNSELAIVKTGEQKKFDLNNDGYYDVSVKLESIAASKAKLTMKSIYEKIVAISASGNNSASTIPSSSSSQSNGAENGISGIKLDKSGILFWVVLGIITILILIVLIAFFVARNNRKIHYKIKMR